MRIVLPFLLFAVLLLSGCNRSPAESAEKQQTEQRDFRAKQEALTNQRLKAHAEAVAKEEEARKGPVAGPAAGSVKK